MAIVFTESFEDNPPYKQPVGHMPRVVQHFSGRGDLYQLTENQWNTDSGMRWEVFIPNAKYSDGTISPGYLYLPRTEYILVHAFRRTRKGKYLPITKEKP